MSLIGSFPLVGSIPTLSPITVLCSKMELTEARDNGMGWRGSAILGNLVVLILSPIAF